MANKSILDVDVNASSLPDDAFFINSNQSLKQIKKNNIRFDYDTNVINKPSINGVELCGGDGKSLNELGIGSSADIADLRQSKADVMVHTAKGSHITVNNSADAFLEGLKIYGKSEQVRTKGYQLFNASKIPTKSAGGATVTNNGDGSFTISGSGNLTEYFGTNYQITDKEVIKNLFKTGKLYLKNSNTFPYFLIYFVDNEGVRTIELRNGEATITEDILNNVARVVFSIYGDINGAIARGTIRPMVYQDGDGTWEPFTGGKPSPSMDYKQDPESSGDGGNIGLEVFGKNLCPISSMTDRKDNPSGSIYLTDMPICEKYTLSCNVTKYQDDTRTNTRITIILRYSDGTNKEFCSSKDTDNSERDGVKRFKTVTATLDKHKKLIGITIIALDYSIYEGTLHAIAENIQMECGSGATDFVPYQDLRSTPLSTPNGLLGPPVDSGGNYTDSNGQKWICDEMDFKRGKYVQRVRKVTFNGSEAWTLETNQDVTAKLFNTRVNDASKVLGIKLLCDGFLGTAAYQTYLKNMECTVYQDTSGNYPNENWLYFRDDSCNAVSDFKAKISNSNITAIYPLKTPIETDIPEETMTAYRKLYTNSPTTVIQNGDNAYMEVDYATYTCRANKEDVKDLVDRIEDLQSYVGYYTDNHVVGLQVDYKNKSFKRLAGAKYLKPGSDFNKYKMFGGRRKCIVEDSGKIVAWHGDKNYTEDGSLGQVMVYQPAFYYRVQPLELDPIDTGIGHHLRKANYYVSDIPSPGFKRHPAFYDASGNEIDYFLTSAYEGSIWDADGGVGGAYLTKDEQVMNLATDKFCSIAGVKPASGLTQNLTRPNIETLAQNRGTNWHGDLIKQVSAEQMLMIIEIGMMNLQTAIAQGVVSIADNSAYNCSSLTGSTSSIGNGTGRATETVNTKGDASTTETADGKTSICWRGKENFWGNIWKFVYGINIWGNGKMGGGQPYICSDFSFAESKNSGNYEPAGFTVTNVNGYISAMGYSTACDWLFIASECLGNSSLPVGDYTYITANLNGYRIALLGGCWTDGGIAGAFYWALSNGVGDRYRTAGGRLVYIPTRDSAEYTAAIASWKEQMKKAA